MNTNTNDTTPTINHSDIFSWEPEDVYSAELLAHNIGLKPFLMNANDEDFCGVITEMLLPITESDTGISVNEQKGLAESVLSGDRLRTFYHVARLIHRHCEVLNETTGNEEVVTNSDVDANFEGRGYSIKTIEELAAEAFESTQYRI